MFTIKVSLFNQVLEQIERSIYNRLVKKHETDKFSKGINTWTHFVSMLFMQLAKLDSLRDISNGLRSATGNLSHLGVEKAPCKSSLSYINKNRKAIFFEELYFKLLEQFEPSLAKRRKHARSLKRKIFIMDSSIIPLCLSLFDCAKFNVSTNKYPIRIGWSPSVTVMLYERQIKCVHIIKKHINQSDYTVLVYHHIKRCHKDLISIRMTV